MHRPAKTLSSLLAAVILCGTLSPAVAQTKGKGKSDDSDSTSRDTKSPKRVVKRGEPEAPAGPAQYTSKNFVLNTDLQPDEAKELLVRLETMLGLISGYWKRPNTQTIQMFVVKDMSKWPPGSLDPEGVDSIREGGGITLGVVQTLAGRPIASKAPVYATADRGTPQHEAVHAYCILNFGTSGPVWYSEGMAEMGQYWRPGEKAVQVHDVVIQHLKRSKAKSLNEIVNGGERTGDSWQNYAWRWALCHLLATNENYAPRFRPLGLDILMKKGTTFEDVYGSMASEISFEYLFFLKHVENGFRCDLCSWDWKAKYKLVKGSVVSTATIEAGRGWQPTRALVKRGEEYQYSAAGQWKVTKEGDEVDADGAADGSGKLLAVLFDNYELSEPFELGAYGTFTAPGDGQLLVRCNDKWTEIADNAGKMTVKIAAANAAKPLPNPKELRTKGAKSETEAKSASEKE